MKNCLVALYLCSFLSITITIYGFFTAFAELKGMFLIKDILNYMDGYEWSVSEKQYTAFGHITMGPDVTQTVYKKSLNPVASTCKREDYFNTTREQRDARLARRNVSFVFVPGHMGTGNQSLIVFWEIERALRKLGMRASGFHTVDFSEQATAFSHAMLNHQTAFLISSMERIRDLGPEDEVVVIGSSFGGIVSALAAVRRPDLFGRVKALVALSSPLNASPLPNSLAGSQVYREIHRRSRLLPPLIQNYGGVNDKLVNIDNSLIRRYRNVRDYYYAPAMKDVFFDVLHSEMFLGTISARKVGSSLADYFSRQRGESISQFWRENTQLVPFAVQPHCFEPAQENPRGETLPLPQGFQLINEDAIRGRDTMVFEVDASKMKEVDYVVIATLPAQSVRVYYRAKNNTLLVDRKEPSFSFRFPFAYCAIPLSSSELRDAEAVYIQFGNLSLTQHFLPRKSFKPYNNLSYYVALKEYKKCSRNITYADMLFRYRFTLASDNCTHHIINIEPSLKAFLMPFTIKLKSIQHFTEQVKYSLLVLLNQEGKYTALDFYMHFYSSSRNVQSITEFPYPGLESVSLEFFGVDELAFGYEGAISLDFFSMLKVVLKLYSSYAIAFGYSLNIFLLSLQLSRTARNQLTRSSREPLHRFVWNTFRLIHRKFPHILLYAAATAVLQCAAESLLRPYGMLGLDYPENYEKIHVICLPFIIMGAVTSFLAQFLIVALTIQFLEFYADIITCLIKCLFAKKSNSHRAAAQNPFNNLRWLLKYPFVRISTFVLALAICFFFVSHVFCIAVLAIRVFIDRVRMASVFSRYAQQKGAAIVSREGDEIFVDYAYTHFLCLLGLHGCLASAAKFALELCNGIGVLGNYDWEPWYYLPYYVTILIAVHMNQRTCVDFILKYRIAIFVLSVYSGLFSYEYAYRGALLAVLFMYLFVIASIIDCLKSFINAR